MTGQIILQLVVGFVFIYHAWPKLTKPEGMAAGMKWPKWGVLLLGLVEALGGLGVALGVYVVPSAAALALTMLGAIYYKVFKWKVPFWAHNNTGWEFDLVLLAAALSFLINSLNG